MKFFSKRARTDITGIIAGVLVVSLSPVLALNVSGNWGEIVSFVERTADSVKQGKTDTAKTQEVGVNNGTLILYSPTQDGEVTTQPITLTTDTSATENEQSPADSSAEETQSAKDGYSDYEEEAVAVLSRNISEEREDLSVYGSHDGSISSVTFEHSGGESYIDLETAGQVINYTEISNSQLLSESLIKPDIAPVKDSQPQVLIIHTHTTESYQPSSSGYYDGEYTARTTDSEKSVVAVGAKIAEEIAKSGYAVIHDGTVHDFPMFSGSYERSAETVKAILAEYPSVKIVLDIHRDAIESEGAPVAAVTEIDSKDAAQIMIISAADDGSWGVPNFMENFRFACFLQSRAETDNPGITRPVLFQYCSYNQDLSTGSLLIEVGSHGNTLEQALYAGELLGKSIGKALDELEPD